VFDEGNLVDMLRVGRMPPGKSATDKAGMANGIVKYSIHLEAGEKTKFFAAVPYHGRKSIEGSMDLKDIPGAFYSSADFWRTKTDHIRLNLPPSADRIIETWRSNLVYILINREMLVSSRGHDPMNGAGYATGH
jgi:hypothetical protein